MRRAKTFPCNEYGEKYTHRENELLNLLHNGRAIREYDFERTRFIKTGIMFDEK